MCVLSGQVFDVGVGVSLAFVQQVEYIEIKSRISYAALNWFTCPTSPVLHARPAESCVLMLAKERKKKKKIEALGVGGWVGGGGSYVTTFLHRVSLTVTDA